MADNHEKCEVIYGMMGPDSFDICILSFERNPQHTRVIRLKSLISAVWSWDNHVKFELHKVNLSPQEWSALPDGVAPLIDRTTKLPDLKEMDEIWPGGFPVGSPAFIVKLKSDTPPRGSNSKDSRVRFPDFDEVQSQVLDSLKKHSSSTLARPHHFKAHQETKYAIYNGRPHDRLGPPIGLFHPVFDSFLAGLDPSEDVPPGQLKATRDLLKLSQRQYDSETGLSGRTATIVPVLNELLDAKLLDCKAGGAEPDGSVWTKRGAFCLVMEVKNEAGLGGSDPSIQGAISYAKYWGDPTLDKIRKMSCCPSFILAIMGPWMSVHGAIMLDHPVVQTLTSFRWIEDVSTQPSELKASKIARMFTSLSSSISALNSFYDNPKHPKHQVDETRFHPYLRHFEVAGNRTDFKYVEAVSSDKLVYHARTGSGANERTIIVKFVQSYHGEAHRLLADAQLAPPLLFVSSEHGIRVDGRSMIVMEEVNGSSLAQLKTIPQCVKGKVSDALKLLHKHGIVFGDLRHPNVMAVQDDQDEVVGGRLVDFDWCGKDGEGKYPIYINTKIKWPADVGPGTTMRAEHDWEMFDKMFSS